jgi:hypothetical protein
MEVFFCVKPAPRINKQSLFPTYGRLLFSRKAAKAQRNLTANGSNLLLLVSCFFFPVSFFFSLAKARSRKEIYSRTALCLLLLGSCFLLLVSCNFSFFARKGADTQRDLTVSRLLLLVSCFLSLVSCPFLLFARKGAEPQRNLIANESYYLILAT